MLSFTVSTESSKEEHVRFPLSLSWAILKTVILYIAIIENRKSAWAVVNRRKHEVLPVYTRNPDFSDIMLLGELTADLRNGKQVVTEFIAQMWFEGDVQTMPKGALYKVWGVRELVNTFCRLMD